MESKIKITVNYDLADSGSKEFFEDLVSKMCFLFGVAPIKKPRYFPNGIRIHEGSFENENRN